jgi:hypothetical protein
MEKPEELILRAADLCNKEEKRESVKKLHESTATKLRREVKEIDKLYKEELLKRSHLEEKLSKVKGLLIDIFKLDE